MSFSYERLKPSLYKWANYFEVRSGHKYEFWELINAVWVRGNIQKIKNIKYVSRKVYQDMVDYMRLQGGRTGCCKNNKLADTLSIEYFYGEDLFIKDILESEENFINEVLAREIWKYVFDSDLLNEREKMIMEMTYKGTTAVKIGKILGITGEYVAQIRKKTLLKLRKKLNRSSNLACISR